MMKYLYPDVNWEKVSIVGFDMDGTLYDEIHFIEQVYISIAELLAPYCLAKEQEVYFQIIEKWKEKGSSYPYIFSEVLEKYEVAREKHADIITRCLERFRGYQPILNLSDEVRNRLEHFRARYSLFLITDGNAGLQERKLSSLGLQRFFDNESIGITGVYGKGYEKPSLRIIEKIHILKGVDPASVVYFGDRNVDREFAANAGFQYVQVKCLQVEG